MKNYNKKAFKHGLICIALGILYCILNSFGYGLTVNETKAASSILDIILFSLPGVLLIIYAFKPNSLLGKLVGHIHKLFQNILFTKIKTFQKRKK